jgi:hypothetical protein
MDQTAQVEWKKGSAELLDKTTFINQTKLYKL